MNTTLNEIKKHQPCKDGWKKLLKTLHKTEADDEPLSFEAILNSNGIEDAIWCLRVLPFEDQRHFVADVAESVLRFFEDRFPDDDRPRKAIETLRAEPFDPDATYAATTAAHAAAHDATCASYAASAVASADASVASYAAAADASYAASAAASYAASYDAVAYVASVASVASADAKKDKWSEIETIFKKHYC